MADVNASVALGVNSPDPNQGLNTLNKIMSLGQQGLNIRGEQSRNVTLASQAQQSQIETQRQQGLQSFFQQWDPSDHDGADGTTDMDSARQSPAYKNAGLAKPDIDLKLAQIKQAQLQNKQSLTTLNGANLEQFGKVAQALSDDDDVKADKTDPVTGVNAGRAKVDAAFQNFSKLGPDAARVASVFSPVTQHAPPGKLITGVKSLAAQAQDISSQQAQTNPEPTSFDTGGKILPATIRKDTGIPTLTGQEINKVTPPSIVTLPNSQLGKVAPGGSSYTAIPQSGPPTPAGPPKAPGAMRTAQDDAPPPNAPKTVQDAYSTATANANAHVDAVRTADETYGNNKAIANAVRTLSAGADTGPGTQTWNHVMGVLGTKGANNYQELGAFLDRQAATVRGQMGLPGTNAGQEDAKLIAGNTNYNAKVIQDKNNYTEALTDGLHMYRNGLDRVAGFGGQASPTQVSKFKSAWTNSFDPNVLIGENAYKRSKAEGDAFVSTLAPNEAAGLKAKRQAMLDLSNGRLSQ